MNIIINEQKQNIEVGDIVKVEEELFIVTFNPDKFCDFPYVLINLSNFKITDSYDDLMVLNDECILVCKNKNITLNLN